MANKFYKTYKTVKTIYTLIYFKKNKILFNILMVGGIFYVYCTVRICKKNYQNFTGYTIIVEYTNIRQGGL